MDIENLFYMIGGEFVENKRSTITDVAKLAGVSITTVSRVINKNYPVSEKTTKHVNKAIEELGFRPNLLARSLIQDKTQTIGVLTPSIENLFFSEVIKGIDNFMGDQDYRSFLCNTKGHPENEREMIDSLLNRSVDGIIVIDPRNENIKNGYYEGISNRIPLVIINGYHEGIQCHFVLNDDYTGTGEALRHLKRQGAKRIALMRGEKSHSYDIKEAIYEKFCMDEYQTEPVILLIEEGNGLETVNQAKECAKSFFANRAKSKDIDAILCCNDFMAVGVLNAARLQGIQIPDQLSIVGFDNTIVSQITDPALTTVDHHMSQLGNTAARQMIQLIENKDQKKVSPCTKIMVATNLIVRQT